MLVDDEPWARRRLLALLDGEPDIEVVAECADGESAIRALRSAQVDLLLLDIHMPGLSGRDVLDAVTFERLPVIVFVTAHAQYAIDAFDRDAVDYLLKPFDEPRFRTSIARARRELAARREARDALDAPGTCDRRFLSRLAVQQHGRIVFVKVSDIDTIEAAGNYVSIRAGGETHLARLSMTALEARLDPDRFARIHRSAIVNLDYVREVRPWSGGEQVLVLGDGRRLTIGRAYRSRIARLVSSSHRQRW
jgi:two-component system, LytTR family, response regulator